MGTDRVGVAETPPSHRWATALAVALGVLSLALTVAGLALLYVTRAVPIPDRWGFRGFSAILAVLFAGVGTLIESRHPRNPVGWLLLALGLQSGVQVMTDEYAVYALLYRPGAFGGAAAAWVQNLVWIPALGLGIPWLLLLFPSGRLLSSRSRYVFGLTVVATALLFASAALQAGQLENLPAVENPLGIPGAKGLVDLLVGVGFLGVAVSILASAVSLVLRLRRARGEEREQIKWFVYAGSLAGLALTHMVISAAFSDFDTPTEGMRVYRDVAQVMAIATVGLLPVAMGIAMLKYRLYDINLVINRTLVYVPLTAVVAGVYTALIGVFKSLLITFTGVGSDAAVALTTLLVVPLLTPLKNYFQAIVDRYLKETRDPGKEMARLESEVQAVVQVLDEGQLTQRLLDRTIAAFDAQGGAIYRERDGTRQLACRRGQWDEGAQIAIPLHHNGRNVGVMLLGPRPGGSGYADHERDAIQRCANTVASALMLREARGVS